MAIEYLKKAEKTAATGEDDTRKIVADMRGGAIDVRSVVHQCVNRQI